VNTCTTEPLSRIEETHAPPEQAPWELPPMSDAEAEDVIACYNRHLREADAIRQNAERLIKNEENAARRLLDYHRSRLEEWARGKLTGKRRSVRTLRGVAGFRSTAPALTCTDRGALLAFARESRPEALTEGVDLGRVAVFKEGRCWNPQTGEEIPLPPGVEITAARESFFVKPGTGKGEEDAC
jgi:hypothetical protein